MACTLVLPKKASKCRDRLVGEDCREVGQEACEVDEADIVDLGMNMAIHCRPQMLLALVLEGRAETSWSHE